MNLITVDELATMLQVPKSWIYDRTRNNRIPYIKIGKYIRFDKDEIIEWIKNEQPKSLNSVK